MLVVCLNSHFCLDSPVILRFKSPEIYAFLTQEFIKEILSDQCFPVVLFIVLFKVVHTFECMDDIMKCDHWIQSYWAVLSCGAVYYAVQCGSNFWVCGWNPKLWPFRWKLLSSTFLWCFLLCCPRWFKHLSGNEIIKCIHSGESYWAVTLL